MKSKKKCSTFTFYRADENKEGKLYYISFKFACLSLYIIGFYYVLLSIVLFKSYNVTKRGFLKWNNIFCEMKYYCIVTIYIYIVVMLCYVFFFFFFFIKIIIYL
ncbi:hypothetical protein C923_02771 [Plasmodium falciparum UGT5.1]|uniref:Uncharacterized protein n=1 Tax=Plasmodium falciparum UGT5.1 TaxID=1237627 RepID=W7JNK8_PLAFA|nr:hypothetical protein C923_02771 [Plasmodium falciparum UGT5.1]